MASARSPCGSIEAEPAAGGDIGRDELVEERRLAHAGLADDGQVPAAVVAADAEDLPAGAELRAAEDGDVRVAVREGKDDGRFQFAAVGRLHRRGADGGGGRMPEGGEFLGGEEEPAAGGAGGGTRWRRTDERRETCQAGNGERTERPGERGESWRGGAAATSAGAKTTRRTCVSKR